MNGFHSEAALAVYIETALYRGYLYAEAASDAVTTFFAYIYRQRLFIYRVYYLRAEAAFYIADIYTKLLIYRGCLYTEAIYMQRQQVMQWVFIQRQHFTQRQHLQNSYSTDSEVRQLMCIIAFRIFHKNVSK